MDRTDWPLLHALTRDIIPRQHSPRCPCNTHKMQLEHCSCWILNDARRLAVHVEALYARRGVHA
jgi:hypothetical protein